MSRRREPKPLGDLRAEMAALLREVKAQPVTGNVSSEPADHRSALAIVLAQAKAKAPA
jgi:hypothetical protein